MTRTHYNIAEKTDIIVRELGPGPAEYKRVVGPNARMIAEATEGFTFVMLCDLVTALRTISRGSRNGM